MTEPDPTTKPGESTDLEGSTPPPVNVGPVSGWGRTTVVLRVHRVTPDVPPMTVMDQWGVRTESLLPAYTRPLCVAGADWQPLDLGWLADGPVGLVLLANDEGRRRQTVPTPDEVRETAGRVLEVSFQGLWVGSDETPDVFVLPATTLPVTPTVPRNVRVRGRGGKPVRFTVTVVPG